MPGVDDAVREIKQRVEQAQRAATRAEMERDSAQAALDNAEKRLKSEYGVESPKEAAVLLEKLEGEVQAELAKMTTALDAAAS